jgi:formate hydrogenlyase subunit 3/multisubunit Na+/H+ antiporter MnhD subunit
MSAPLLWIFLPLILTGMLLLINNEKVVLLIACLFTLFLTLAAWLLPIDVALNIGRWTLKLAPSFEILGRNLTITSADRSFLALIYGSTFFWFIPTVSLQNGPRLISLGLAITSMLVAAIAVEPFLYAALIIEMAILLSIPMLTGSQQKPSKGVIRFLIFQTLAVPFILFSGWLLTGIGTNPDNVNLVQQASILLGLGFAFMLAIFPFYSWIPILAEEVHPYAFGFLLWVLPTATLFYGLGFLDRFAWLRELPSLTSILTVIGALMVVSGGLLSAFQHHLGRIMGFAIIVETGFSLLALSMLNQTGLGIFLLFLVPRTLILTLWALSLSILKKHAPDLTLNAIKGMGRTLPFAISGVILANLALAGLPLLAGFPVHQAVWEALARNSLPLTFWVLVGSLGLFISGIRILISSTDASEGTTWKTIETPVQRLFVTFGLLGLFLLGLFPQWAFFLWTKLPAIFEHFLQ